MRRETTPKKKKKKKRVEVFTSLLAHGISTGTKASTFFLDQAIPNSEEIFRKERQLSWLLDGGWDFDDDIPVPVICF